MNKQRHWITLYKNNTNFRHLLKAHAISNFGDWFNFVAVSTILLTMSDQKSFVAYLFIIHLIPFILFTPLAGVFADKFPRQKIMLITDIIRFFIILLIFPAIYIHSPELILGLLFIQFTFSAFFEPARSAIVPDVVSPDELFYANSILAAIWSIMMSLGMSIGGLLVYATNVEIALLVDAFTFLISYFLIRKINIQERHINPEIKITFRDFITIDDYLASIKYLKKTIYMIPVVLSKGVLEIYTGAFVFLITLYGEQDFMIMGSAALSIGLLQTARGIGTGIGPLISRRIAKTAKSEYLILPFWLILIPFMYYILSYQTSFVFAMICIFLAHIGGGANWVVSENIIHKTVPNTIRGRIISFEYLFFTLIMSISIKSSAILIDSNNYTLQSATHFVSIIGLSVSFIWLLFTFYIFKKKYPIT